jgi:ATP-dependent DNA ligase
LLRVRRGAPPRPAGHEYRRSASSAHAPTLVDRPPAGAGWLREVKHDGFRILVRKLGERAKVWSRRGADFTDRFSTIAEAVGGLSVGRALIDGEAVVLMDDGRSDFHALMTKRGGAAASLIAFDFLSLDMSAKQRTSFWLTTYLWMN